MGLTETEQAVSRKIRLAAKTNKPDHREDALADLRTFLQSEWGDGASDEQLNALYEFIGADWFPDWWHQKLCADIAECEKCSQLGKSCLPAGPIDADLMLIGEAPGENEVEQQEPFVGRAGEKLSELLADHGFNRAEIYITNAAKCRPPDNRTPRRGELERCRHLLAQEMNIVQPDLVVTLGTAATRAIYNRIPAQVTMSDVHGRRNWRTLPSPCNVWFWHIPTYHPATLLYSMEYQHVMQQDWARIAEEATA